MMNTKGGERSRLRKISINSRKKIRRALRSSRGFSPHEYLKPDQAFSFNSEESIRFVVDA